MRAIVAAWLQWLRAMLFRIFAVGLLLSLWWMVAVERPSRSIEKRHTIERIHDGSPPPPPAIQVLDLAPGVPPSAVANLLRLAPNETIVAVDDQPVPANQSAHMRIMLDYVQRHLAPFDMTRWPKGYIDVDIASPAGARRAVFLMH